MSRSPRQRPQKPARQKLTELVQTHVTPAARRRILDRLKETGEKESAYVRRLILQDLGVIIPEKDR